MFVLLFVCSLCLACCLLFFLDFLNVFVDVFGLFAGVWFIVCLVFVYLFVCGQFVCLFVVSVCVCLWSVCVFVCVFLFLLNFYLEALHFFPYVVHPDSLPPAAAGS